MAFIYLSVVFVDYVNPMIKNKYDVMTKGKNQELSDTYTGILSHVIENPEEWRISKNSMRFPKEGNSARISIIKEDNHIEITQDSVDNGNPRIVKGYFYKMFSELMDKNFKKQSMISMVNALYPDKMLMLENSDSDSFDKISVESKDKVFLSIRK